jgi:hypothetical protein
MKAARSLFRRPRSPPLRSNILNRNRRRGERLCERFGDECQTRGDYRFLMKRLLILLVLVQSTWIVWADGKYDPVLLGNGSPVPPNGNRSTPGSASYCLYLGSAAARRVDVLSAGTAGNLWLVHPVRDRRWYVACAGVEGCGAVGGLEPLLEQRVWRAIPAPVQRVLDALGVDDPDLVVISCRLNTGSVYIYFNTAYVQDLGFYQRKLALLKRYVKTHDMETGLRLEELRPGKPLRLLSTQQRI